MIDNSIPWHQQDLEAIAKETKRNDYRWWNEWGKQVADEYVAPTAAEIEFNRKSEQEIIDRSESRYLAKYGKSLSYKQMLTDSGLDDIDGWNLIGKYLSGYDQRPEIPVWVEYLKYEIIPGNVSGITYKHIPPSLNESIYL